MDAKAKFCIKGLDWDKYYNLLSQRTLYTVFLNAYWQKGVFSSGKNLVDAVFMLCHAEVWAAAAGWAWSWKKGRVSSVNSGLGTAEKSSHFQITFFLNCEGFALETLTPEMSLCLFSSLVILTHFWKTGHSFLLSLSWCFSALFQILAASQSVQIPCQQAPLMACFIKGWLLWWLIRQRRARK